MVDLIIIKAKSIFIIMNDECTIYKNYLKPLLFVDSKQLQIQNIAIQFVIFITAVFFL